MNLYFSLVAYMHVIIKVTLHVTFFISGGLILQLSLLLFLDKPAFDGSDEFDVQEGKPASLTCPLVGNPLPSYTWYEGNNTNKMIINNIILAFQEATKNNSGWYTCFAENNLGNRTARVILSVGEFNGFKYSNELFFVFVLFLCLFCFFVFL